MGAFLLSSGAKGKRMALPNSEIMIHQPSGGAQGQATEIQIAADHILKTRQKLNQILAERVAQPTGDFQLGFVPTTGPNIQWEAPEFNIEYEMDKLNFSARIGKGDFEFIPGSIELQIEQMPDIRIEYVGKPLYVPPSAAERFEGKQLDVQAQEKINHDAGKL